MFHWASSSMKRRMPWLASLLVCGFLVLAFLLIDSHSASALPIPAGKVYIRRLEFRSINLLVRMFLNRHDEVC